MKSKRVQQIVKHLVSACPWHVIAFLCVTMSASTSAAAGSSSVGPAGKATLSVTDEILKPFTRDLIGLNYAWASMQSFGGERKAISDDLSTLLKGVPLTLNRMAGDSQHMSWKKSIGPQKKRAAQKLVTWAEAAPMRVGAVEWMKWVVAHDPNASFVWVLNLFEDSSQDAADLVEFLTGDPARDGNGGVNWAELRVQYGLRDPVRVAYWEIGNEMDLRSAEKRFVWSVDDYIKAAAPVVEAILAIDPKAVITIQGSSYFNRDWNRKVLQRFGHQVSAISEHYYYGGRFNDVAGDKMNDRGFGGHKWSQMEIWMDHMREDILTSTGNDKVKVHVSEHAMWPVRASGMKWEESWWQTHSLEGALTAAQFLTRCFNRPEVVATNYHSFTAGPWSLFYRDRDSGKFYRTGMAEFFRFVGRLRAGVILKADLKGDGTDPREEGFTLAASAIRNERGCQLILVNRGALRTIEVKLPRKMKAKLMAVFSGPSIEAVNSSNSSPIHSGEMKFPERDARLDYSIQVPANSVAIVELEPAT